MAEAQTYVRDESTADTKPTLVRINRNELVQQTADADMVALIIAQVNSGQTYQKDFRVPRHRIVEELEPRLFPIPASETQQEREVRETATHKIVEIIDTAARSVAASGITSAVVIRLSIASSLTELPPLPEPEEAVAVAAVNTQNGLSYRCAAQSNEKPLITNIERGLLAIIQPVPNAAGRDIFMYPYNDGSNDYASRNQDRPYDSNKYPDPPFAIPLPGNEPHFKQEQLRKSKDYTETNLVGGGEEELGEVATTIGVGALAAEHAKAVSRNAVAEKSAAQEQNPDSELERRDSENQDFALSYDRRNPGEALPGSGRTETLTPTGEEEMPQAQAHEEVVQLARAAAAAESELTAPTLAAEGLASGPKRPEEASAEATLENLAAEGEAVSPFAPPEAAVEAAAATERVLEQAEVRLTNTAEALNVRLEPRGPQEMPAETVAEPAAAESANPQAEGAAEGAPAAEAQAAETQSAEAPEVRQAESASPAEADERVMELNEERAEVGGFEAREESGHGMPREELRQEGREELRREGQQEIRRQVREDNRSDAERRERVAERDNERLDGQREGLIRTPGEGRTASGIPGSQNEGHSEQGDHQAEYNNEQQRTQREELDRGRGEQREILGGNVEGLRGRQQNERGNETLERHEKDPLEERLRDEMLEGGEKRENGRVHDTAFETEGRDTRGAEQSARRRYEIDERDRLARESRRDEVPRQRDASAVLGPTTSQTASADALRRALLERELRHGEEGRYQALQPNNASPLGNGIQDALFRTGRRQDQANPSVRPAGNILRKSLNPANGVADVVKGRNSGGLGVVRVATSGLSMRALAGMAALGVPGAKAAYQKRMAQRQVKEATTEEQDDVHEAMKEEKAREHQVQEKAQLDKKNNETAQIKAGPKPDDLTLDA